MKLVQAIDQLAQAVDRLGMCVAGLAGTPDERMQEALREDAEGVRKRVSEVRQALKAEVDLAAEDERILKELKQ